MMAIANIGFIILTVSCIYFVHQFFCSKQFSEYSNQIGSKFLLISISWISFVSLLSLTGFLSNFSTFPPRVVLIIIIPLLFFIFFIAPSKKVNKHLESSPTHVLIFLQAFRIPVEILLWVLYKADALPIQMTYDGLNYDIVTGILAIPVGYYLFKKSAAHKFVGIIFNIIGLLLLVNIVSIAILSMPSPIRYFMNEPANVAVTWFPIVFLPAYLVPMAYYMHILSLKQLLLRKK